MKKNIKKLIFSLALAAGIALVTAAVCSFADYTETVGGITYTYKIVDDGAKITMMSPGPGGIYIMPDTLGGHPVTEFNARILNRNLRRVTIPSSLRSLSANAFSHCDDLNYNEYDNGYYLGTAENPYHALIKAKNEDITSCQINSNTKVIAGEAFKDCSNLTSVTIPEGVKTIGDYAFWNCSRLESVTIPSSVIYMKENPFLNCDNLNYNEYDNGLYLGNDENPYHALIKAKNKDITSCQINSDTKVIAGGAFRDCNNLTSIDIPENITRIETYTFYNCDSLTSVTIPKNVTFIGLYAFYYSSFADAFIPNDAYIYDGAFNESANIWRYQVNSTQDGKTHVTITSVEDGDGNPISVSGSLACNAMGDNYVIDSIDESLTGVQLGHTLTQTPAKAATCTTEGNAEYWTCSHCGKYFSDAAGTTEIAEGDWVIPATGHAWGNPTYEWAQDNSTCTATRICGNDASHVETETATATVTATTEATCVAAGSKIYTTEAFENAAFEVQEKVVEIPATGHKWSTEWSTDDENHWHECTVCHTKKDDTAHAWSDWTQVDDTNHKRTCTVCGAEQTVAHSWNDPVVTKEVTDTEAGEMKYECGTCGAEKVEVVPALENYVTDPLLKQTVTKDGEQINCIVQDPYEALPDGTKLVVTLVEPGTDRWNELNSQLDSTHPIENVAFFDINLYDLNDNKLPMPLARKVRVLLQIPEGWDKEDMEAVLIAEDVDIEFEESIVTIDGVDYVAFWTDHFSPYAEIDELTPEEAAEAAANAAKSPDNSNKLKTGEEINSYIMFGVVLILASVILFIALRRRQKILFDEKK